MRPSALATYAQQSEGVLTRSIKQNNQSNMLIDNGLVVQQRDSEPNGKAEPVLIQNQKAMMLKQQLNIVVQDPREDTQIKTANSDLGSPVDKMSPIKPMVTTPQGIVKRVMPDKVKSKMLLDGLAIEMQAHSVDPDRFQQDTLNSIIREKNNGVVVMQTHRAPGIVEQRVPPLTDDLNTNLQNFDNTSQISMNINSTFRQEVHEDAE